MAVLAHLHHAVPSLREILLLLCLEDTYSVPGDQLKCHLLREVLPAPSPATLSPVLYQLCGVALHRGSHLCPSVESRQPSVLGSGQEPALKKQTKDVCRMDWFLWCEYSEQGPVSTDVGCRAHTWCWDVPLHLSKGPLSQHPMRPGPQKMLGEKLSKELGEWVGGWRR